MLRCDWLGRIGLPLTRAVCHLAAHPSDSDRWLHRPRWVGWLVRYLDIYLFYVCDPDLSSGIILSKPEVVRFKTSVCGGPYRTCPTHTILRNTLFDALHQLSGSHSRKLFSVVTLLQFLSLGLRHSSFLRLSLLSLLTKTLSGPSASYGAIQICLLLLLLLLF